MRADTPNGIKTVARELVESLRMKAPAQPIAALRLASYGVDDSHAFACGKTSHTRHKGCDRRINGGSGR